MAASKTRSLHHSGTFPFRFEAEIGEHLPISAADSASSWLPESHERSSFSQYWERKWTYDSICNTVRGFP